ncbi:MAG: DUF2723 domain-containing protein [Chloroflexota bacterium]
MYRLLPLGAGVFTFLIYTWTLAPTITWHPAGIDSGDFATAIAVRGVPHPSGYPTYLLLGQLFTQLSFGDIAYRLNLLSATCAALTIAILTLIIHKTISDKHNSPYSHQQTLLVWVCALSASLIFAFSSLFWSQAIVTEVYTLNTLFAAFLLYGFLHLQRESNLFWVASGLAFLWGLSLGNHLSIGLWIPIIFWGVRRIRWSWKWGAITATMFCLGLSVYLTIPIRAASSPPLNWGNATSWQNFWWLISGAPYRQFVFALPWEFIPQRIGAEFFLMAQSFLWGGLFIALLGLLSQFQYDHTFAKYSLITVSLFSIYAIGYNTSDSLVYLLPAWLLITIWLGWGFWVLLEPLTNRITQSHWKYLGALGALFLLPLLPLTLNFSSHNLKNDYEAIQYVHESLQIVEADAIIVTEQDRHTFALWYGRYGLALRSDVAIINHNLLSYDWYRQTLQQNHPNIQLNTLNGQPLSSISAVIAANIQNSPIYLAEIDAPPLPTYTLKTVGPLQHIVDSD